MPQSGRILMSHRPRRDVKHAIRDVKHVIAAWNAILGVVGNGDETQSGYGFQPPESGCELA